MFGLIQKLFIVLLRFSGSIVIMANGSNFTTWLSLNNQPCMNRSTLINLNPNEYNQRFHYYPLMINLDTDVMEVVIFLMVHSIEYVFQTKQSM